MQKLTREGEPRVLTLTVPIARQSLSPGGRSPGKGQQPSLLNLAKWRKELSPSTWADKTVLLKPRHLAKGQIASVGLGLEFCISNLLLVEVDAAGA